MERTLAIIKPDAVAKGLIGKIIAEWEKAGFKIIALKMVHLTKKQAKKFYWVHRKKDFYESLTNFMSSGPCVALILEGENVIQKNRDLMGATNPADAEPDTIRAKYGTNVERNAVHGSDSPSTAEKEIKFFFNALEIFSNEQEK